MFQQYVQKVFCSKKKCSACCWNNTACFSTTSPLWCPGVFGFLRCWKTSPSVLPWVCLNGHFNIFDQRERRPKHTAIGLRSKRSTPSSFVSFQVRSRWLCLAQGHAQMGMATSRRIPSKMGPMLCIGRMLWLWKARANTMELAAPLENSARLNSWLQFSWSLKRTILLDQNWVHSMFYKQVRQKTSQYKEDEANGTQAMSGRKPQANAATRGVASDWSGCTQLSTLPMGQNWRPDGLYEPKVTGPMVKFLGGQIWTPRPMDFAPAHCTIPITFKPVDISCRFNIYIYIYICPLLLGGGGPTCRFIAIIWGGGPPQYTMFWKSGPPQWTIIWKKGVPHKHESSQKKKQNSL